MKILTAALAFMLFASGAAFAQAPSRYVEGTAAFQASGDLDILGNSLAMDSGYLIGFAIGGLLANAISVKASLRIAKETQKTSRSLFQLWPLWQMPITISRWQMR